MSDVSSVPSRPTTPLVLEPAAAARPYRFVWDPAQRRPGPESVSGTTEGRAGDDFGDVPAPFNFLNPSSLSLALGTLPAQWSSSRTGFHAISTVLNNPHKRQAPPKAHSSLPSVAPAELPRVRRKDFESYLRSIGPEWERYQRGIHTSQDQDELSDLPTPRNSVDEEPPPTATPASVHKKPIPSLDSVPDVFFRPDFNLGDSRTFATIMEIRPANGWSAQEDIFAEEQSTPLLERFSGYADTVEQHLVREIGIRSPSFFAALTNLHDLQSESEQCLDRVSKLRTQLRDVDNNSAKKGLEMVRAESKLANLQTVRQGVTVINGVVEMTAVVKDLLHAGQWGEALGIIEQLDRLWDDEASPDSAKTATPRANGHSTPSSLPTMQEEDEAAEKLHLPPASVPLRSLHAFAALPSHLRQMTMQIAASLSSEFVQVLRHDLELRAADMTSDSKRDEGLKDRLKPLLLNLVRTKGLKEGMLSWREVVLVDMRSLVKKILPDFGEEVTSMPEGRTALAQHLRSMGHSTFLPLIQRLYRLYINSLNGLKAQGDLIVQVLDTLRQERGRKLTDITALQEDLHDILRSSGEVSNTQTAKIVAYRSEQHASLEFRDFLTFFNDSWAFVLQCETICNKMIVGLRGPVMDQAKVFLQSFHQTRLTGAARRVEDELWNQTEVTPALQHAVDILVDSAVRDHPELFVKTDDAIFSGTQGETTATRVPKPTTNGNQSASASGSVPSPSVPETPATRPTAVAAKQLRIEDRSFYVVSATAEVLTLLLDYLKVVVNLPLVTPETMTRVIEFLKAFNSRTCQVVLGAGAMRSAGLRNITAKHLALASQSLSVVNDLIPYVRETFRRHLKQTHTVLLVEFDKLRRDYQEHQNEIHEKLIAIMGDRLNAHVKNLRAIDWNVIPPRTSGGANNYMEVLVRETVTLHKVLSRYLSAGVVEYVMSQVFAAINHLLSEEYAQIALPHHDAKARLLADAQYLHRNLSALSNVRAPTAMLETVVLEKSPRTQPTTSGSATVNGTNSSTATIANPSIGSTSSPGVNATPPRPTAPTRSQTLTANQRIMGLFNSRATGSATASPPPERAQPPAPSTQSRTPSPPPVPPEADKPLSPIPPGLDAGRIGNSVYGSVLSQEQIVSMSGSALTMHVSPIPRLDGGPLGPMDSTSSLPIAPDEDG